MAGERECCANEPKQKEKINKTFFPHVGLSRRIATVDAFRGHCGTALLSQTLDARAKQNEREISSNEIIARLKRFHARHSRLGGFSQCASKNFIVNGIRGD